MTRIRSFFVTQYKIWPSIQKIWPRLASWKLWCLELETRWVQLDADIACCWNILCNVFFYWFQFHQTTGHGQGHLTNTHRIKEIVLMWQNNFATELTTRKLRVRAVSHVTYACQKLSSDGKQFFTYRTIMIHILWFIIYDS